MIYYEFWTNESEKQYVFTIIIYLYWMQKFVFVMIWYGMAYLVASKGKFNTENYGMSNTTDYVKNNKNSKFIGTIGSWIMLITIIWTYEHTITNKSTSPNGHPDLDANHHWMERTDIA